MPQIPVFTADMPVEAPPQPRMDIAAAGEAAQALARGAAQLEGEARPWADRYADSQRAMMAKDAMVGANTQIASLAQEQIRRAGTHDENGNIIGAGQAADNFTTGAAKVREQALGAVTDPLVKEQLASQIDEAMIGHGNAVRTQGFARESAAQGGVLDAQLNQFQHDYAAATDPIMQEKVLQAATTAINTTRDAGFISGDRAAEQLIMWRARAQTADARGDINKNPAAAIEKLNNPAGYPDVDELTRQRLIAYAENKARGGDAALRGQVESAFNDNLAAIERNGDGSAAPRLSVEQIRAAFPERADAMIAQLHMAGDFYRAVQSTGLTSPQEDAALVAKWQPQGAGFAMQASAQDELRKALEQKYQQLGSDKAGYVLSVSPDIRGLFDAAQKDPAQLGHAIGALDAAYDKLGVPDDARRVMPLQVAQAVAADIERDPASAPDKLAQLQQLWGDNWPRAWRDLATIGKLPVAYQAVGTLPDQRDGGLLARWLKEAQGKQTADLLGPKGETEIKNAIRFDPAVQDYLTSYSRSGSSAAQVDGIQQAIEDLGFAKRFFNRDPNAALNAVTAFTDRYDFTLPGAPRVPRDRASDVHANADITLQNLDPAKLTVSSIYGKPGMPPADDYVRWVKGAPSWLTAPSGDALMLYDPMGRLVRGKDGVPITVPFAMTAPRMPAPPPLGWPEGAPPYAPPWEQP